MSGDHPMRVGAMKVTVRLFVAQSLKEKRSEVKRILARVKNRAPVAMAEVGHHDLWQLAQLGFTAVSNDPDVVERLLDTVIDEIESRHDAEVTQQEREIFAF